MHIFISLLWTLLALVLSTGASVLAAPRPAVQNSATFNYQIGTSPISMISNTVSFNPVLLPTPAEVTFYRVAQGVPAAQPTPVDGGQCFGPGGALTGLPLSVPGNPNISGASAPVLPTNTFHAGEPVVINLHDDNRNQDAQAREIIDLEITTSSGDFEKIRLLETDDNSGIFTAVLPTVSIPPTPVKNNCALSVAQGVTISARYVDAFYPTDIAVAQVLIDPFGIVFNSSNSDPVTGATVSIIDAITGLPAIVFGDDHVSRYPSTMISGQTVTDSSGNIYTFSAGTYRFPYLAPGQYRLVITPPDDFVAPSSVSAATLGKLRDPEGNPFTIVQGSFSDIFTLVGPEPIRVDIPVDPVPGTLALTKAASVTTAAAGDLIQYELTLQNRNRSAAARNITIRDVLPAGLRYRRSTLRTDGKTSPDPLIGPDGRTLTLQVPTLPPGGSVTFKYVTQVISGITVAEAINQAVARSGGSNASNVARVSVRIDQPFFTDRFTIIGRVVEDQGKCVTAAKDLTGVRNIRVLLENGSYVLTDSDGQFHFDGVRPGTHVVQLDLASLPAELEAVSCIKNTRFGSRAWSQFVEARGGTLWRTDFYLRRKDTKAQKIAIMLERKPASENKIDYSVVLNNNSAKSLSNIRFYLQLPNGEKPAAEIADMSFVDGIASVLVDNISANTKKEFALQASSAHTACMNGQVSAKAFALFDRDVHISLRTPTVDVHIACTEKPAAQTSSTGTVDIADEKPLGVVVNGTSLDDSAASGDKADWFAGLSAGAGILFPPEAHNPRAPVIRVVIKHAPGQKIILKLNGAPVDAISYDGSESQPAAGISISKWRGLPLLDGPNSLAVDVRNADDTHVASFTRVVHYANQPARAEIIQTQSSLLADGLTTPVLAVRFTDRHGKPVRKGISGTFELEQPYLPAQAVDDQNRRQLEGRDRFDMTYNIDGDDGIARIALQPTQQSGLAVIHFYFGDETARKRETLRVWLQSAVRDWIVVGFAKGTLGFETLHGKAESLPSIRTGDDTVTDGQISLYAKGRIKGKWLLTVAYDSDREKGLAAGKRTLLGVIDPNKYYTLYGDQTQQGFDAASLGKVYLKLERDQFYAMFGDFETGLTQTELSRYSRSFTGIKTEYRTTHANVTAFAAKTAFSYARDEIQGTGLSAFYRLSKSNIIINSDKIYLETRDRFRSEKIVTTKQLVRHIDYDIDYDAGSLTFREPVRSRDSDFNPVFIVANYEVLGVAGRNTTAGGRIGGEWRGGKVQAGITGLHEEGQATETNLGGVDFKARLGESTELRAEAARSRNKNALDGTTNANAYIVEVAHRSAKADALAYYRKQDSGFGVGQQNNGQSGTEKYGIDGRVRINGKLQLAGTAYRETYASTGAARTFAQSRLEYGSANSSVFAGLQYAADDVQGQSKLSSKLISLGGSQYLLNRKLELQAQTDFSLGGGSDSVDYPTRYRIGAAYAVTDDVRLILNHEISNGREFDSATTRFGFDVVPWKGARLTSTLNQARISEYGPRTYGQFGLTQTLLLGERWSVDAGIDSNQTFNTKTALPATLNSGQPLASGGQLGTGDLIEDFVAVSTGATYRTNTWTWNTRAEWRDGTQSNRYALTSNVLRQTQKGVAVTGFGQFLKLARVNGQSGTLATLGGGLAYRPLGSRWAVLDKLEFKSDVLVNGSGGPGSGLFGFNSAQASGNIKNQRIINNFTLNRVSRAWRVEDNIGNMEALTQRTQWSVYYGSKYTFDTIDDLRVSGYTHMLGVDLRHDISPKVDIGLQASVLHSLKARTLEYAIGPQIGIAPFTNSWLSLGYNIKGFRDDDFTEANYTQKGPYITLRLKFDQSSLGLTRK